MKTESEMAMEQIRWLLADWNAALADRKAYAMMELAKLKASSPKEKGADHG